METTRLPVLDDGGEEIIDRLWRAVSTHDPETGRHLERVSRYAVLLAGASGFAGLPLDDLGRATTLHDVGTIGVPDHIRQKTEPLSRDEEVARRHHPQIGYQLLSGSSSRLVRTAAEIALHHHEWWDGSGYPRGLREESIPEAARIAAIADVFDALTTDRVHQPAVPLDRARAEMAAGRGRRFDPRLLDAFLGSISEVAAIRDAYVDPGDPPARIRILIVDDHEIFAQSLVRLLAGRPELQIVGTASSVAEALSATLADEPDVVLMDFALPDGAGPEATEQIKALIPGVKVIMLTGRADGPAFARAAAAGCSGFVSKMEGVDSLLHTIVAVSGAPVGPPVSDPTARSNPAPPAPAGLGSDLTPREVEILRLLASGLVNRQIARGLGIRTRALRNEIQRILDKLRAHSKFEAVSIAASEGIFDSAPRGTRPAAE